MPADLSVRRTLLSKWVACSVPGSKPVSKSSSLSSKPSGLRSTSYDDLVNRVAERDGPRRRRVEVLRAAQPDLLGLAVDGHLGPAGGDPVAHLPLGQHDRLVDLLLDRRRQVLVDLKRDRHRHVGAAAEGDDRLVLGQRPGGPELALARPCPGRRRGNRALRRDRPGPRSGRSGRWSWGRASGRPCNESTPAAAAAAFADPSAGGITLGTIGKLASAMWVTGSSLPDWILNTAIGIESSPRTRSSPPVRGRKLGRLGERDREIALRQARPTCLLPARVPSRRPASCPTDPDSGTARPPWCRQSAAA